MEDERRRQVDIRLLKPALQEKLQDPEALEQFRRAFYRGLGGDRRWPMSPYLEARPTLKSGELFRGSQLVYQFYFYETPSEVGVHVSERLGVRSSLTPLLKAGVWERLAGRKQRPNKTDVSVAEGWPRIVEQVAKGIETAHQYGLCDLRITPENIILSSRPGGRVRPILVDALIDHAVQAVKPNELDLKDDGQKKDVRSLWKLWDVIPRDWDSETPVHPIAARLHLAVAQLHLTMQSMRAQTGQRMESAWRIWAPEEWKGRLERARASVRASRTSPRGLGTKSTTVRAFLAKVGGFAMPGDVNDVRYEEQFRVQDSRESRRTRRDPAKQS